MGRRLRVKRAIIFFSVLAAVLAGGTVFGLVSGADSRLPGVPLWVVTLGGTVCAIGGVILVLRQARRAGER